MKDRIYFHTKKYRIRVTRSLDYQYIDWFNSFDQIQLHYRNTWGQEILFKEYDVFYSCVCRVSFKNRNHENCRSYNKVSDSDIQKIKEVCESFKP